MPLEPFENDSNFQEDVGMFEAAVHPHPVQIDLPPLDTILLALDGSDQDQTARLFAQSIVELTGAQINECSVAATASESILNEVQRQAAQLLVIPVPCGQDYRELSDHSLGSVVDVLLLDCPCPMFCVRDRMSAKQVDTALSNILIPVVGPDSLVASAIGWAFRLLPPNGQLELFAVADREIFRQSQRWPALASLPDLSEHDALMRGLLGDIGGIVAATQKFGIAANRGVHVETRVGRFVPTVMEYAQHQPRLLVWPTQREHAFATFHRAVDLLLNSANPVLIV